MFYKLRIIDKEQSVNRKQNVNIIFNEINKKKIKPYSKRVRLRDVSVDLFSRAAARQVFSALKSLTTVFGMGTGGPSSS